MEKEGYAVTTGILEVENGVPVSVQGAVPDLILLNNDLTSGPLPELGVPILPSPKMGWYQRRKSDHFRATQPFLEEVAELLDIDPWLLSTHWVVSEDKCLEKETCRTLLAAEVDNFLAHIQAKYDQYGIEGQPTLFVKNDSGTYGLGILEIQSGEELLNLSKTNVMATISHGLGTLEELEAALIDYDGPVEELVIFHLDEGDYR